MKVAKAAIVDDGQGEFEETTQRPQTAGGARGRGGDRQGGNRDGGRGRGGDRQGGNRDGGDREAKGKDAHQRGPRDGKGQGGGRGRGRPRTAVVEGEEGPVVERAEAGGKRDRFHGKAREEAHPYDRKDGTGKAHRGDRKGGNSKGTWGNQKEADDAQVTEAAGDIADEKRREERKGKQHDKRDRRERQDRKQKALEEEKEETAPVEEEEEVGFTLDDYLNQQQAKSTGVALAGKARDNEKNTFGKAEENKDTRSAQFQTTYDTKVTKEDLHTIKPGQGAELLGFGGFADFGEDDRRRYPKKEVPVQQKGKGGRKGKMVIDDNDFPAL